MTGHPHGFYFAIAAFSALAGACGGPGGLDAGGDFVGDPGRSEYVAAGATDGQLAKRNGPMPRTQVARATPPSRAVAPSRASPLRGERSDPPGGPFGGPFGGFFDRTEPGDLIGGTPWEVKATLGSPSLVRRETPAEVWQYRTRSCVLDLFLSDLGDGRGPLVRYVEGRDRAGALANASNCIETIRDAI